MRSLLLLLLGIAMVAWAVFVEARGGFGPGSSRERARPVGIYEVLRVAFFGIIGGMLIIGSIVQLL